MGVGLKTWRVIWVMHEVVGGGGGVKDLEGDLGDA